MALHAGASSGGGSSGGGVTIGASVTGGTPSTLLYVNSGGNVANSATIPFALTITPATPGNALTLNGGTITTNLPAFAVNQTINAAGVTFHLNDFTTTVTAAAAGSTLQRWIGGAAGTTVLDSIDYLGNLNLPVGGIAAPSLRFNGLGGIWANAQSLVLDTSVYPALTVDYANTSIGINGALFLGWYTGTGSLAVPGQVQDVRLYRDAANTLALRNGVNAQTFNVYNTYTDASNYERLQLLWTSNLMRLSTTQAGTGAARAFEIGTEGSQYLGFRTSATLRFYIDGSTGNFLAQSDNTYDIGGSGATRPRNFFQGGYRLGTNLVSPKASTPVTVATSDSNTVFTNENSTALVVFNLPTAAANLTYTFAVQSANGVQIVANTGDMLQFSTATSALAGNAISTALGAAVILTAINTTAWLACSIVGTWTLT